MARLDIQIELPDKLAKDARAAGLLEARALEDLLREAVRRRALKRFLSVADDLAAAGIPEMTPEEIDAEIKAFRDERRRAAGT